MRILITEKASNLDALTASLARSPRAAASVLERIQALNPHLADVRKLDPGTVVILPDAPDIKGSVGDSATGAALAELNAGVRAGMRVTESRVATRLESLNADHAAVRVALKSAKTRRLIEANPALRKQLEAAETRFKAEQKSVKETSSTLTEFSKLVEAELERLQKLFA